MRIVRFTSLFIFFTVLACGQGADKKLIIAISKTAPESHYVKWLQRAKPDVQYINFY